MNSSIFSFKILILLLPGVVVFLLGFQLLKSSRELYVVEDLVACQASQERCLIGLKYTNPVVQYKFASVVQRRPQVLALGTSRVMAFRADFFKPSTFFNVGGAVGNLRGFSTFLNRLPKEAKPELLIVGLDQTFFNKNSDGMYVDNVPYYLEKSYTWDYLLEEGFKGLREDVFVHGTLPSLQPIFGPVLPRSIGLTAYEKGSGFINDGSYYYGHIVQNPDRSQLEDYEFKSTLNRIRHQKNLFEGGTEVNPEALSVLEEFLNLCRSRNIEVVAFLPPYAHAVYEALKDSGHHSYMAKIYPALEPLFQKYHYTVHDFSDLRELGASDREVTDGFHGSEKTYLRLFLKMLETTPILKKYSADQNFLKERLVRTTNDFTVFPESP
ncbi:MAG: hypothetical protein AB7F59_07425 [Bdellovibrionales bacterium]